MSVIIMLLILLLNYKKCLLFFCLKKIDKLYYIMYPKRLHKSFQQSLLDNPVPKLAYDKKSKRIKALPPPLVPTQYVTLAPKPKPRRQQPVALPRNIPKVVSEKVKKLIDEIKPYYRPEAISKFAEDLKNRSIKLVKVIKRAFRNYAKTYSVKIIEKIVHQINYISLEMMYQ